jgi:hypothetical protein
MLLIILTFLLTTAFYGALLWLAVRRVLHSAQGDEKSIEALTRFVLVPLLGRRPDEETDHPPGQTETP